MSSVLGFSISQYGSYEAVKAGLGRLAVMLHCRNQRGFSVALLLQRLALAPDNQHTMIVQQLRPLLQVPPLHTQPCEQKNIMIRLERGVSADAVRAGLDRIATAMTIDGRTITRSNLVEYLGYTAWQSDELAQQLSQVLTTILLP